MTCFPAARVPAARAAVAETWQRVARTLARLQLPCPAAPVIEATNPRIGLVCQECRREEKRSEALVGDVCHGCQDGYLVRRSIVDLAVTAQAPIVGGWELVAVLDVAAPRGEGLFDCLIRTVPGAIVAEGELDRYRACAWQCDHCQASRARAQTFVVRADGSRPSFPRGTLRQIGRTCLQAFLGGVSIDAVIDLVGWPSQVTQHGGFGEGPGEGGSGGRGGRSLLTMDVMIWTAAVIRVEGWRSRTAAQAEGMDRPSTADRVCRLLAPPAVRSPAWEQARAACVPTPADVARGAAALEWARGLAVRAAADGRRLSDYEHNLSLVSGQERLELGYEVGLVASAVIGHAKYQERQVGPGPQAVGCAGHVGSIGEKIAVRVTIDRVIERTTDFGPLRIVVMHDEAGHRLLWRTGTEVDATPGEVRQIGGRIKAHSEYQGAPQTEITRCKWKPIDAPASADQAERAASPRKKRASGRRSGQRSEKLAGGSAGNQQG